MKVRWTQHAEQRQKDWQTAIGISRSQVEDVARNPEQVVTGHGGLSVAQFRIQDGLLRVVFFDIEDNRIIVTVYWTSQTRKYWEAE